MESGKRKVDEDFYFLNMALRLWKHALVVKPKPLITAGPGKV